MRYRRDRLAGLTKADKTRVDKGLQAVISDLQALATGPALGPEELAAALKEKHAGMPGARTAFRLTHAGSEPDVI